MGPSCKNLWDNGKICCVLLNGLKSYLWEGFLWFDVFLNLFSLVCFHLCDAVTSCFLGRRYNSCTNSCLLLPSSLFIVGEEHLAWEELDRVIRHSKRNLGQKVSEREVKYG